MKNPVKKEREITLGGHTYHLTFDFEAIAEAEEITGKPLLTGLGDINVQRPKINDVRALFFASAKANDPSLTYEAVKPLINAKNILDVWLAVLQSWDQSSPEPEEGSTDSNPNPDQK